jgi:hypothetical protein
VSWLGIIQTHYPGKPLPPMPDLPKVLQTASTYPEPHRWAGKGMTALALAMEPSAWEVDDKGQPLNVGRRERRKQRHDPERHAPRRGLTSGELCRGQSAK